MSKDGNYRDVIDKPVAVNSFKIKGHQILLGEIRIPEGEYKKLKFTMTDASIISNGQTATLALPPGAIEVPINITVHDNQSEALFVKWNPDSSVESGYMFNPLFSVSSKVPELSRLMIYVTNEDSGNVSVINRQSGEVVGSIMVGKKPRGIIAGLRKERLKIYVANSSSNSVSVIDPATNRVEQEIPIRLGRAPEGIAVAEVSSNRELVFVANYDSSTVSIIDPATFNEFDKVSVGNGPIAVAADPPVTDIFGSRFLDSSEISILQNYRTKYVNVYVANKNSNSISVIKVNIHNNRVEDVFNIDVEWSPVALSVDYVRGRLYVANNDSDRISVIDIVSIVNGNFTGIINSIENIGSSAVGVAVNPVFDRVYILKEMPSEIMVINSYFEGSGNSVSHVSPIISSIPVPDSPRAFMLDPESRKLYVVSRSTDSVSVINTINTVEEKGIPVGRNPYGIAMFSGQ
ncbi:MAG: YncE family protein [Nitrospirae bacterium]|nr:YncE family protein [Nitrospirota bacterium]